MQLSASRSVCSGLAIPLPLASILDAPSGGPLLVPVGEEAVAVLALVLSFRAASARFKQPPTSSARTIVLVVGPSVAVVDAAFVLYQIFNRPRSRRLVRRLDASS
ncbi:MAG TPA: hypothetical protein VEJ89_01630 [Myxococcaceae bacterium]|jgi:ABC-type Co2+ transport system permease subunit|nr:hypothetical protein [Myxococcaceae bacterium]